MKTYTDIKSARRHQRQLTEYFNCYKARQEELRQYIRDKNLQKDAPLDIRLQIFAYRKTMNHIQEEIKQLNKNIRRLDQEATQRDIERVKREFPNLFNHSKVIDADGTESYYTEEFRKKLVSKVNKTASRINKKARDKQIYNLLVDLRDLSDAFNKMGGYLYSSICADEINEILAKLKKYGVDVDYYQVMPGRVTFPTLYKLIEKYEKGGE